MIEALLGIGKKGSKEYPNSGPGPITLQYGDETLGYFGTLTSAEMFTTTELANYLDLKGSTYVDAPSWVKCFINGRILFTPTQRLRAGVSWNDLYNAGSIYGDDTNGLYPVGGGVKQDAVVTKGPYAYRVRVWGKGDTDPTTMASTNYPPKANHEYLRFITQFFTGTGSEFTGSWRLYPIDDVVGAAVTQMITAVSNIVNNVQLYYPGTTLGQILHVAKTTPGTWWPVLELVDFSNALLPIKAINLKPLDDATPSKIAITSIVTEVATPDDNLKAISTNGLSYDTVEPKAPAITSLLAEADASWLTPISYGTIKQPTLVSRIAITSAKYEA